MEKNLTDLLKLVADDINLLDAAELVLEYGFRSFITGCTDFVIFKPRSISSFVFFMFPLGKKVVPTLQNFTTKNLTRHNILTIKKF